MSDTAKSGSVQYKGAEYSVTLVAGTGEEEGCGHV